MAHLDQLLHNRIIVSTFAAWVIAQGAKMFLFFRQNRRFDVRWVTETGGMPSAHSAGVAALAMSVGLTEGVGTTEFGIELVFALVTMFDAQGVRRAAGRQAVALNKIIEELYAQGEVSNQRVRELLGHTPVEVFVGGAMGALVAWTVCRW